LLKFLVPFSWFVDLGRLLRMPAFVTTTQSQQVFEFVAGSRGVAATVPLRLAAAAHTTSPGSTPWAARDGRGVERRHGRRPCVVGTRLVPGSTRRRQRPSCWTVPGHSRAAVAGDERAADRAGRARHLAAANPAAGGPRR